MHADCYVNSNTLYVCLGSSRLKLKGTKACCVSRDPAVMHPVVFKGPATLPYWLRLKCPMVMLGLIS